MSYTEYLGGYEAACAAAAREERLDLVSGALEAAGVDHTIDQTGGFCMVLRVTHGDQGCWTVTRDDDDPASFLCIWWPGDSHATGDDEATLGCDFTVHVEGIVPWLSTAMDPKYRRPGNR